MNVRTRNVAVAIAAAGLTAGLAGAASADSTPQSFAACLSPKGVLSNVAYGSTTPSGACGKKAQVVTWNQQGPKGDKGDPGAQGPQGDKGDTGAQGVPGDKGATGAQGLPGEKGDKGDNGDTGAQGLPGDKGAPGDKGDKGDTGPQGLPGDKGDKGDKGDTGATGANGVSGYRVMSNYVTIGVNQRWTWRPSCNSNETAISGGWNVEDDDSADLRTVDSFPVNQQSWQLVISNLQGYAMPITLYVVCVRTG